ncbi:CocE/NonD family hydrolase [Flavobacteriaceae bacterium R38]|nr:CocE/NonD family hydrolase [Flavobacteriaceae bacterium R38]
MQKTTLSFIIILFIYFSVSAQDKAFDILYDQTFKLSDGTVLAHDLYLPKGKTKFPSILIRTPYSKSGVSIFASYFAKNGFAVLVQDVRGKGESKGVFIPFMNEKKDGQETLDWVSKQSWCDGKIGLWGSSYLGYCALSLADINHPALKSIFNLSGWIDGSKVNYPGGAFHQMLIIPWLLSDGQTSTLSEKGADLDEMFAHTPLKEAIPGSGETFKTEEGTIIPITNLNSEFVYKNVKIPIFHMIGWSDFTIQATIDAYASIQQKSDIEQYFTLGPWYHNQIYDDYNMVGDYKLPENGNFNIDTFLSLVTNWFKHTLLGESSDFNTNDKIKYYVLFSNEWKYTRQWPPNHTPVSVYLQKKNSLSFSRSNDQNSKNTFVFDPKNPVPTLGGANFHLFTDKIGIKNQAAIEARDDVLLFTTSSFKETKTVAGNIAVELHIETEGKGTDFTAKLTLVDKTGISRNIVDGIKRIEPHQLKNNVKKITIELGDVAFKIAEGEKLRLQISSSNYPKFNRNPNTGIDPLDAIEFIPVKQTIHHSKKYPSRIIIPFLKE